MLLSPRGGELNLPLKYILSIKIKAVDNLKLIINCSNLILSFTIS